MTTLRERLAEPKAAVVHWAVPDEQGGMRHAGTRYGIACRPAPSAGDVPATMHHFEVTCATCMAHPQFVASYRAGPGGHVPPAHRDFLRVRGIDPTTLRPAVEGCCGD